MVRETLSGMGNVLSEVAREPRRAGAAVRGAAKVGWLLVRDPRQIRYMRRWIHAAKRTTMDLELPWLPFEVIDGLDAVLKPDSRVFEYGGGGSTIWLAQRAGEVITTEHHPEWIGELQVATAPYPNVTILSRSADNDYDAYVHAIDEFPDNYFDVVVVDGRRRVRSFERSLPKLRPGGLILLDDSTRSRYRPAFDLAENLPTFTVRGLAPTKAQVAQTTIWRR